MNRCRQLFSLTRRFSSSPAHGSTSPQPPIDLPCMPSLDDALLAMGRGDKRTRRGKIFKGTNGKSRPHPGKEDKHKSWMQVPFNPLVPSYKLPKEPSANDIPFL
mmetsp:Transcript_4609/g.7820  ORF Transcript_4609/g.7820 Transcript_4609/m.7820 type:complete len:104 (-) Transcript_4609:771-1082(-)